MAKWFSVTGTFEYLILADDADLAIEQSEEDLANMGIGIISVDEVKEA